MLVKFTSSTSGQIKMFAPVARQLLEILGKECTARGVITSKQIPEAIDRLRAAVAGSVSEPLIDDIGEQGGDREDAEAPRVGLGQRAFPLIEVLEWTRKKKGYILWEASKDF